MSVILLNTSTQNPVVIGVGITQPSLYYVISSPVDGSPESMEGATVNFLMRPLTSRVPILDFAAVALSPPDNDGHNVRYDWQTGDTDLEDEYRGWWLYQLAGWTEPATATGESSRRLRLQRLGAQRW